MDLTPSALDHGPPEPVPLLLGPGLATRLEALHRALGVLHENQMTADPATISDGVAALVEVAQGSPAGMALPVGWRASRLDLPFNGGAIVTVEGLAGEELTLQLDAARAPFLATWGRRVLGTIADMALFDVAVGPAGFELRLERGEGPRRVALGLQPPGGAAWTRQPVWRGEGAAGTVLPVSPLGGLLLRGALAVASHLAKARPAAEVAPAEAPEVVVVAGPGQGRRVVLGERAGIGRGEDNAVTLGDALASRNHALVERTDDGYRITDLDSLYGTVVNGERIRGERALADGDEIVIGVTRLRFEWVGRRPAEPDGLPPATPVGVGETPPAMAVPVSCPEPRPVVVGPPATTCPRCQAAVRAGVRFCTVCGGPLQAAASAPATCPGCGRPARPGVAFCTGCGQRLNPG